MTGTRNLTVERPYIKAVPNHGVDKHKLRPATPLIMAWDGYDLTWTEHETEIIRQMWKHDAEVQEIAQAVDRPEIEVILLLLWMVETGKIVLKPNEVLGWRGSE